MEMRAVLDTNVVLAAENSSNANSPNREIIRRWLAAEFLLLVTDDVLAEYADKLSHIGKSPQEVFGFLSRVLLLAEAVEIRFFHLRHYPADPDDAHGAMEECRLAVEKVVLPRGQPVELLPRSERVRTMQAELVSRYRLRSAVFGRGPQQRLRVFPA